MKLFGNVICRVSAKIFCGKLASYWCNGRSSLEHEGFSTIASPTFLDCNCSSRRNALTSINGLEIWIFAEKGEALKMGIGDKQFESRTENFRQTFFKEF